jgi:demethylmenaquinone methyltransferase/2-methoxy-6-polyprenyl-1,4-benzoquinol methylase
MLKAGGSFGMIEVSLPRYLLLRGPYMWYLSRIVPLIGRRLLGNPDNYRMLRRYVAKASPLTPIPFSAGALPC